MTTYLTPAQPSLVTQGLNIFVAYQMYFGSWIFMLPRPSEITMVCTILNFSSCLQKSLKSD